MYGRIDDTIITPIVPGANSVFHSLCIMKGIKGTHKRFVHADNTYVFN